MSLSHVSNPFSTGGGGVSFENKVYASFIADLLIGGVIPNTPLGTPEYIRFQARQLGYHTDDCLIQIRSTHNSLHRIVFQVKHGITYSDNQTFRDVVASAWADYNNSALFNVANDRIVIVSEPLPHMVIQHLRPLLYWAQFCQSASEFVDKVNTAQFSSEKKRNYCALFKSALVSANGAPITDDQLWGFFKVLTISGYDFDELGGSVRAHVLSRLGLMLDPECGESLEGLWAKLVLFAANSNAAAGTVTRDRMNEDITRCIRSIDGLNLQAGLGDLNACLEQVRCQVEPFIETFPASMREEIEESRILAYDKLTSSLPDMISKWYFNSYHVPTIGKNFLEGLAKLWKTLTLLTLVFPDLTLINSEVANLRLDSQPGIFRQLIYSTHNASMPEVVLAFAKRFVPGLHPQIFVHPLIVDNHLHSNRTSLCKRCGRTYQFGQIIVDYCFDTESGPYGEESNTYNALENVEVLCTNCLFEAASEVQTIDETKTAVREAIVND